MFDDRFILFPIKDTGRQELNLRNYANVPGKLRLRSSLLIHDKTQRGLSGSILSNALSNLPNPLRILGSSAGLKKTI